MVTISMRAYDSCCEIMLPRETQAGERNRYVNALAKMHAKFGGELGCAPSPDRVPVCEKKGKD